MQSKYNKQLVPLAKQLRKEMTREERHLWYGVCPKFCVNTAERCKIELK